MWQSQNEPRPKNEDEELPRFIKNNLVGTAWVALEGTVYTYYVLALNQTPDEPPLMSELTDAGAGPFFFISETVPEKYRDVMMRHVIQESLFGVEQSSEKSAQLLLKEMEEIPEEQLAEFIKYRVKNYRDTIENAGKIEQNRMMTRTEIARITRTTRMVYALERFITWCETRGYATE